MRQLDQLIFVFELLQPPFQVCFEASLRIRARCRVLGARRGPRRRCVSGTSELELVPAVHVSPADVRAWREAINFRNAQIVVGLSQDLVQDRQHTRDN